MALGITPAGPGLTPLDAGDMPQYMQWQLAGVDLGDPDIQVVDLATGFTATRGTGLNANKLTLGASGGGGGAAAPVLVLRFSGQGTMDAANIAWTGDPTEVQASTDAAWSAGALHLSTAGLYEVTIHGRISVNDGAWPSSNGGWSHFGSYVPVSTAYHSRSRYFRQSDAAFGSNTEVTAQFTDTFLVDSVDAASGFVPYVYANTYGGGAITFTGYAQVMVRRIGPAA